MRLNRNKLVVTNSEQSAYQNCRQLWAFQYREGLRPKRTRPAFAVGGAVHAGLAAMYRGIAREQRGGRLPFVSSDLLEQLRSAAFAAMDEKLMRFTRELYERADSSADPNAFDEAIAEAQVAEMEARSSVDRYITAYADDATKYVVVASEQPFMVPLRAANGHATPRASRAGVMDLVLYDPDNRDLVLTEFKTTAGDARKAEEKLDMDPQTTGYVWALRDLVQHRGSAGWLRDYESATTGRVFYVVIKKSGPKQPKWNKDGMLSAAQCDTTRAVYAAALQEQEQLGGLREDGKRGKPAPPTEKQLDLLNALPTSDAKWIARHETWHSADVLERWRAEAVAEATQIRASLRGSLPITRNAGHCNHPWSLPCVFRGICKQDSPELRELDYRVVTEPHMEVVEAEAELEVG